MMSYKPVKLSEP